jgi:hypothetical protein
MPVVTVGNMIDRARAFETRLERYYADLRDRATDDGVRLLTYYLARRKRHLPETLSAYGSPVLDSIRRTPFKYEDTHLVVEKCFEGKTLPSDVNAEKVLDTAIGFVEMLIGFYSHLSRQPLGEDVIGLFQSLVKIEEKDIIELNKIRATHYF